MAKRRLQSQITVCRRVGYTLHVILSADCRGRQSESKLFSIYGQHSMQQGMFNFTETFANTLKVHMVNYT